MCAWDYHAHWPHILLSSVSGQFHATLRMLNDIIDVLQSDGCLEYFSKAKAFKCWLN